MCLLMQWKMHKHFPTLITGLWHSVVLFFMHVVQHIPHNCATKNLDSIADETAFDCVRMLTLM